MDKSLFEEVSNVAHDCTDFYTNFCMQRGGSYKDFIENHAQQFTSKVSYNQCFDAVNYSITNKEMNSYFEGAPHEEFIELVMAGVYITTLITNKMTNEVKPTEQETDATEKEDNRSKVMNALKDFGSLGKECCMAVMNRDKDVAIQKLEEMKKFVSTCFPDSGLDIKPLISGLNQ